MYPCECVCTDPYVFVCVFASYESLLDSDRLLSIRSLKQAGSEENNKAD